MSKKKVHKTASGIAFTSIVAKGLVTFEVDAIPPLPASVTVELATAIGAVAKDRPYVVTADGKAIEGFPAPAPAPLIVGGPDHGEPVVAAAAVAEPVVAAVVAAVAEPVVAAVVEPVVAAAAVVEPVVAAAAVADPVVAAAAVADPVVAAAAVADPVVAVAAAAVADPVVEPFDPGGVLWGAAALLTLFPPPKAQGATFDETLPAVDPVVEAVVASAALPPIGGRGDGVFAPVDEPERNPCCERLSGSRTFFRRTATGCPEHVAYEAIKRGDVVCAVDVPQTGVVDWQIVLHLDGGEGGDLITEKAAPIDAETAHAALLAEMTLQGDRLSNALVFSYVAAQQNDSLRARIVAVEASAAALESTVAELRALSAEVDRRVGPIVAAWIQIAPQLRESALAVGPVIAAALAVTPE